MGEKNIIKGETKEGKGIYIIDIDQDKASKIEGNTYSEKLNNAIGQFLNMDVPDPKHYQMKQKTGK